MKTLIVAATYNEVASFIQTSNAEKLENNLFRIILKENIVDVLITGVGASFTMFEMCKYLNNNNVDVAVNVGICGCFSEKFSVCDVLLVESDTFGDLGVETNEGFETIFEKGFIQEDTFPFHKGVLYGNKIDEIDLPKVKGLTVNKAHCRIDSINLIVKKFNPDVESMEGAAFFYCCLQNHISCVQIRAVSNFVKPRHQACWDIGKAIGKLNDYLFENLPAVVLGIRNK